MIKELNLNKDLQKQGAVLCVRWNQPAFKTKFVEKIPQRE
jgi:hypothetical protein